MLPVVASPLVARISLPRCRDAKRAAQDRDDQIAVCVADDQVVVNQSILERRRQRWQRLGPLWETPSLVRGHGSSTAAWWSWRPVEREPPGAAVAAQSVTEDHRPEALKILEGGGGVDGLGNIGRAGARVRPAQFENAGLRPLTALSAATWPRAQVPECRLRGRSSCEPLSWHEHPCARRGSHPARSDALRGSTEGARIPHRAGIPATTSHDGGPLSLQRLSVGEFQIALRCNFPEVLHDRLPDRARGHCARPPPWRVSRMAA